MFTGTNLNAQVDKTKITGTKLNFQAHLFKLYNVLDRKMSFQCTLKHVQLMHDLRANLEIIKLL